MPSSIELRLLAEEMVALEKKIDTRDEENKIDTKRYHRIRLFEIPELMAELEIKNISFDGLGRVQLASDLFASTREGQKGLAIQWLRDLGYADMVSETYNASSLKALFRRMIEAGTPIPDDMFNVTPFIRASVVKK